MFGAAMMIGWLDVNPWEVVVATTLVYILIGFLLSLLLGLVYDRLGVGPVSFGRALAISIAGSYAAGVLWTVAYFYYRHHGAVIIHSVIVGAPSSLSFRHEWILDGALINGALPLFGWSLIRLGLQYNTALREQRETALPLGRGRVFDAFGKQPVPAWAQELGIRSWPQFALKYIVSHPAVTVAIPGTAKIEYLTDNLGAARGPMPRAAARRRMAALVDGP